LIEGQDWSGHPVFQPARNAKTEPVSM